MVRIIKRELFSPTFSVSLSSFVDVLYLYCTELYCRHFTIRGADGTDFEGGVYHGRILVSPSHSSELRK